MGVTADTPTNLVVGAGDVLRNHAVLGASVDNNVFRIEREMFVPDLNGVKGALKGTHYITSSEGVLETSVPEVSGAIMAAGWPGSQVTPSGSDDEIIDEDNTRRIPDSDYADWELRCERLNGGSFRFQIDNGLNTASLEFEAADDDVIKPRYEIHGTWDPAALSASPHRIAVHGAGS